LARIKLLEKHLADGTFPSGLQIHRVKAKGPDAETLQVMFDEILSEAQFKLLDATTASKSPQNQPKGQKQQRGRSKLPKSPGRRQKTSRAKVPAL